MLKNLLFQENREDVLEEGYRLLKKTKKSVHEDIAVITNWLATQKHLPEITNPDMIENFLKINKFSIELTKQKIDMYYSIRKMIPEIFVNSHPLLPHMKEINKLTYCLALPKLTDDLHRITVMRVRDSNLDNYEAYYFLAHYFNMWEILLWEDASISNIVILDFADLTYKHLLKYTPVHFKKCSIVIEKVYGNRISTIHIVNCTIAESVVNLLKHALNPKLRDRFVYHKDVSTLKDYISKDILPKEYEGEDMSLEELHGLWQLKFEEYKDRFDKLEAMVVNEELRPVPLENDEILGFHGNFKKINLD